jgi:hypothetical protein
VQFPSKRDKGGCLHVHSMLPDQPKKTDFWQSLLRDFYGEYIAGLTNFLGECHNALYAGVVQR